MAARRSTPWQDATADRKDLAPHRDSGISAPSTNFKAIAKNEVTGKRHSSYPHLTPGTPDRAEHVTSNTFLRHIEDPTGQRRELAVYARTHQDNRPDAAPQLDRFFAADQRSGEVFSATEIGRAHV
jgi:hypothetical protein